MMQLDELVARIGDLERRTRNMFRHGTVAEVDAANGTVRLKIGEKDGKPFLSPAIPQAQFAGALKVHSPASVGQQMTLISPNGDFRQAVALPMTWSDQNASPSDKADENVLTFGSATITLRGDSLVVSVGGSSVTISGDGIMTTGPELTHNGKNVGDDHQHRDVEPGGGTSGPPV